jgi:transcriptional regulator with XRE-family HTH domain
MALQTPFRIGFRRLVIAMVDEGAALRIIYGRPTKHRHTAAKMQAAFIKRIMATNGWDQAEMVRRTLIGRTTFSRAMRGEHLLSCRHLDRLARAVGANSSDIVDGAARTGGPDNSRTIFVEAMSDGRLRVISVLLITRAEFSLLKLVMRD